MALDLKSHVELKPDAISHVKIKFMRKQNFFPEKVDLQCRTGEDGQRKAEAGVSS